MRGQVELGTRRIDIANWWNEHHEEFTRTLRRGKDYEWRSDREFGRYVEHKTSQRGP
jgi:hypothetical protein